MKRPTARAFDLRPLLMMPSFYGAVTWTTTLALYEMRWVDWNENSFFSTLIFLGVALSFIVSTWWYFPRYVHIARSTHEKANRPRPRRTANARTQPIPPWLLLLNVAGLTGVGIYLLDVSQRFGGLDGLISTLTSTSYLIRASNAESSSVGTQISYFGWIAAAVTAYRCFTGRLNKRWLALVAVQLLANAAWIDRTRPLTIIFMCFSMYLLSRRQWTFSRTILSGTALATGSVIVFVVIGTWIGKIQPDAPGDTTTAMKSVYFYLTSSYAYCNDVLSNDSPLYSTPHTVAPISKVLAALDIVDQAPSHNLDFRDVPYPTNVGTFLVSFFWDGGWLYLAAGIVFYTVILNALGCWFLSSHNEIAAIGWVILCWVACMAFFTPKIASTETWLFLAFGVYGVKIGSLRQPRKAPLASTRSPREAERS